MMTAGVLVYTNKNPQTVFIKISNSPELWTVDLSKAYARALMEEYNWDATEYKMLNKLWTKESHWNPKAYNESADIFSGKHAGGIPQILGMDIKTPAPAQIEQGLAYIHARYKKPSNAWKHYQLHGWY